MKIVADENLDDDFDDEDFDDEDEDYDEDLGLEFETALFDGLIQCNNRCPFCFIDQQPPGSRWRRPCGHWGPA